MLKPEVSVTAALATGALVYGIYSMALPPVADVRTSAQDHPDVAASERLATWTAAAAVSGIALIARDMNIFVVGGAMTIALAWWYRHADRVIPELGKAVPKITFEQEMPEPETMGATEDYAYGV
jgi:hypothetical protein